MTISITHAKVSDAPAPTDESKIGGPDWNDEHVITGETGDTTWTAPGLLNGWGNFGSGFSTAGYRKDGQGFVHLKGLISGGTATTTTDLFILPVGYRPAERLLFGTISSGNVVGRIDVLTDGTVEINGGNNTWLALEGIHFLAEA